MVGVWILKNMGKIAVGIVLIALGIFIYTDITTRRDLVIRTEELADTTKALKDARLSLVKKDSVIAKLDTALRQSVSDWKKALSYGEQWKQSYAAQVAESDRETEKLTYSQQLLAYYKRLVANGTLAPQTDLGAYQPQDTAVVRAGLQTADREAIGVAVRDSLAQVAALYRSRSERLAAGLYRASTSYGKNIAMVQAKKRGGIWPLNAKRRKQLRTIADSLGTEKKRLDDDLDIVKVLNQ